MNALFYIAAILAVFATWKVITRLNPVHALLYFIVSLFAVSLVFFTLGAPFVAVLEIIIYAGAIMVLFIFVIMLLNLGPDSAHEERRLLTPGIWIGPTILSLLLGGELLWILFNGDPSLLADERVEAEAVGKTLLGPYVLGVEIASMLLLAGLVGAYHVGRRAPDEDPAEPEGRAPLLGADGAPDPGASAAGASARRREPATATGGLQTERSADAPTEEVPS